MLLPIPHLPPVFGKSNSFQELQPAPWLAHPRSRLARHPQQQFQTASPRSLRSPVSAASAGEDAPAASASSEDSSFSWPAEIQPDASSSSINSMGSSSSLWEGAGATPPAWAARLPTWNPSTRKHMHHMMDLFTIADRDGNGILDREEVRNLLQTDVRCTAGICFVAQHRWVPEGDLDDIMLTYDTDGKGGLTFNEFMELVLDGVLLDGTFDEYRAVFASADANGDGCLDQQELAEVLAQLGRPLSPADVQAIMESADLDHNCVIDFNEFLRLFHTQLLDLPRLLRYMKMKPLVLGEEAPPAAGMAQSLSSGSMTLVSGAAQWQGVMGGVPPTTLLVAMFGLSTGVVCNATAAAVQELAAVYRSAVFVRVHIDASPDDKALFKHALLGRATPAFYFFRGGQLLHSHASPSAAVLEQHLREHLPVREQPLQPVLSPQQQLVRTQQAQQVRQVRQQEEQGGAMGSVDAAMLAAALRREQQAPAEPQQQQQQQQVHKGFSMADLVYDSIPE